MKHEILRRTSIFFLLLLSLGASAAIAQTMQANVSSRQVRTVIDRIRAGVLTLENEIDRVDYEATVNNADDRVSDRLDELTTALLSLRRSTNTWSRNTNVQGDLNTIMETSGRVNRILTRNSASARINSQWGTIRTDINTLLGYYNMSANWNTGGGWNNNNNGGWTNGAWNDRVTGTYRLNASMSDNVTEVIDRSVGYYGANERDNQRRMLERRLASPEIIAIEKRGRNITLGSSNQAQVTFEADGVARTETNARGRTVTTRVTSSNRDLVIDQSGDRINDFNVSFAADRGGRLRVTRRIYLENQNQTVSVSSIYDRISQTADWSQVRNSNTAGTGVPNNTATGGFYIPNNVTLTATLRNAISTRASQVGDRFTMEVTSPNQYSGAIIEGHISEARSSGRVAGRANLQMDFDTITVNGRSYQFAGFIQSVNAVNGDNVTINNEGTIRDNSQTNKTVTRAGIGAILGAIIGAVAGGGSGAAIGAGVGAGAGAGSVLIGGRDSIELGAGTTFTILSSAPANIGYVPRN